jgi:hypothetical protein
MSMLPYLCSKVDTKPNTSLNFVIGALKVLGRWFRLFESGWNGLAYKVSRQTWGPAAATTENVNLFVCYTRWYKFWGDFLGRDKLSAPPVWPVPIGIQKRANFPMFLFNFSKEFEAVGGAPTREQDLQRSCGVGPITAPPTWWKVGYNSFLHWMGHTRAQPIIW